MIEKQEYIGVIDGVIHCHQFEDCCGCFYYDKSKPEIVICNECGKEFSKEEMLKKDV